MFGKAVFLIDSGVINATEVPSASWVPMRFLLNTCILLLFTLVVTAKAQSEQRDIFTDAGIRCDRPTSQMRGNESGREVMLYVRESAESFDQKSSMQRKLRKLIKKYPSHPVLNWQAGWLSYLNNDFEGTITHFTIAANQGEPNSAYLLGYIGLGLLDGEDALKPDDSTKLIPIDLALSRKCLEVAANAELLVVLDSGYHSNWFKEVATSSLAAMYMHDVGELFSFRSPWPSMKWEAIPYDPITASQLVTFLPNKDGYSTLRKKIKVAAERQEREERERKRIAKAESDRRYLKSLELTEQEVAMLADKCSGYSTIKGICWALNLGEMRSVLISRGYFSKSGSKNKFSFRSDSPPVISVLNSEVTFACGVFNACDLSMRELANRLQKSGLVTSSMEFDSEYSAGYLENSSSSTSSLCGRGKQGEKICVSETTGTLGRFVGTGDVSVSLGKGLVGKEVSFD